MYYINSFFLYSLFGFIMESDVYKISNSRRHSSIFYGPYTVVYGVGMLSLILLKKYVIDRLKCGRILKLIITYLLCFILLTFVEFICGYITNLVFGIDMWNYENKTYNFGKYICLELSLIWGIFGVVYVYFLKGFTDRVIKLIPRWFSYLFVIIFFADLVWVFLTK